MSATKKTTRSPKAARRTIRARRGAATGTARPPKRTGDLRSKPAVPKAVTPAATEPRGEADPGAELDAATEHAPARTGPPALPGRAVRHMRALGHHLEPVVHVGKEGVTDAVIAQVREALLAHELIKVRLLPEAPVERAEAASELATGAGALVVQVLGRTVLLYKRHPRKARIVLPR